MPTDFLAHKSLFAEVPRNANFTTLGFDLRTPRPGTLTYARSLSFLIKAVNCPNIQAVITTSEAFNSAQQRGLLPSNKGFALVAKPRDAFFALHNELHALGGFYTRRTGFEAGALTSISPHAHVSREGVTIGDRTVIEPAVVIKANVAIGSDCIIRSGSVIGGKGFQYVRNSEGRPISIAHAGGVRIGNRVEIHSLCSVDRHIFDDDTSIGDDTKFDNQVQFAHGSVIGQRCLVASAATISGSVRIGNDVWIGPNATLSDSVSIGDSAAISLGAVVVKDVPRGVRATGNFAEPHNQFLQRYLKIKQPRNPESK